MARPIPKLYLIANSKEMAVGSFCKLSYKKGMKM
jgi:hypothetical protein